MIKKISQLDILPKDAVDSKNLSSDKVLFEISYKTNESNESYGYYNSYQSTLSNLYIMLSLPEMHELIETIANGGLSTIAGNLEIGKRGNVSLHDRVSGHNYYPDSDHTLSVYSKTLFENNVVTHGTSEFHNNVVLKCDDGEAGSNTNPILSVAGTAVFDKTIYGTAYRAQWGDLAEIYEADTKYDPGTLVQFGGEKEITIATHRANAVVTSNPGIVLNNEDKTKRMLFPTEIAMIGKVPIKVIGPVRKFDNIILSKIQPGVGEAYNFSLPYEIIGKALENKPTSDVGLVLCVTNLILR